MVTAIPAESSKQAARACAARPDAWRPAAVAGCAPDLLRVIAGLLLEPGDVRALGARLGPIALRRPVRMLDLLVEGVAADETLARLLAARCARRTACVAHLLACSPCEALETWATRGDALSRVELGALLARLACSGDALLEPLARRLCREVQLAALRALPVASAGSPATASSTAG